MDSKAPEPVGIWVDVLLPIGYGAVIVKAPTGVRYMGQAGDIDRWVEGYIEKVVNLEDTFDATTLDEFAAVLDDVMLDEAEIVKDAFEGWVILEGDKVLVYPVFALEEKDASLGSS